MFLSIKVCDFSLYPALLLVEIQMYVESIILILRAIDETCEQPNPNVIGSLLATTKIEYTALTSNTNAT